MCNSWFGIAVSYLSHIYIYIFMLIASAKIPEREGSISPSRSTHWMKEMRCEFSPLPRLSVKIWNSEEIEIRDKKCVTLL